MAVTWVCAASETAMNNRYEANPMSAAAENVVLITNEEDIYNASHSLKAMAHPLRLKILCLLGATNEVSVQDIVEQVGTSQSNISQHLSILRDKGILASRKDANKVYYRIAEPRILHLIGAMRAAFCSTFPG
jgi:DNA-binding transcriptional ArsR family regulator